MMIIGCDIHPRYQQIAMMEEATGELTERRLDHESGEAQKFYRDLQGPVRVGIEAACPPRVSRVSHRPVSCTRLPASCFSRIKTHQSLPF